MGHFTVHFAALLVLASSVSAAKNPNSDCATNLYNSQQAETALMKRVKYQKSDLEKCENLTTNQAVTITNLTLSISTIKMKCENNKNATSVKNKKVIESLISQHQKEMEAKNESCQASMNQVKSNYEELKKKFEAQKYLSKAMETVQIDQEKKIFSLKTALSIITKNALLCEDHLKAHNISNNAFTISDEMLEENLSLFFYSCFQNTLWLFFQCIEQKSIMFHLRLIYLCVDGGVVG